MLASFNLISLLTIMWYKYLNWNAIVLVTIIVAIIFVANVMNKSGGNLVNFLGVIDFLNMLCTYYYLLKNKYLILPEPSIRQTLTTMKAYLMFCSRFCFRSRSQKTWTLSMTRFELTFVLKTSSSLSFCWDLRFVSELHSFIEMISIGNIDLMK